MYSKLYARITESSLMEEPINVRYTFVLMLAIADPEGYVIGTNVAIARRLNMPVEEFEECLAVLMAPDPNSNSKEMEGRRVVVSNGERGYHVVNFVNYRDMKDPQEKREYMREYMRKRRAAEVAATKVHTDKGLTESVNLCKTPLTEVTHGDEYGDEEDNLTTVRGAERPNGLKDSERGDDLDLSGLDWGTVASLAEAVGKMVPLRTEPKERANDRRQWIKYAVLVARGSQPQSWLMNAADQAARSPQPKKSKRAIFVSQLVETSGDEPDEFHAMVRRINIPREIWKSGILGGPR